MTIEKKSGRGKPGLQAVNRYYTLAVSGWDSYESKCLRNNAVFEIGFINEKKKQPDKYMVYPVKREIKDKTYTAYYLAEHTLQDIQTAGEYSRFTMECRPLHEVELVKTIKGSPFAMYKQKKPGRKTSARKIKTAETLITRLLV